ncbi:hypothetical protein P280DRAFT_321704 [Massarina eburnea CBS 473.64]|uniref:Uncharacterized protein n=1 Tax=Massarina eburnea CBS 473.64 TaxID=1395130 RepID=A0A6A6S2T4_9PLEO|nr:hypothetical protein P280DRAFT_321704 [Massarina eburnea CBS 473.64]
MPPILLHKDAPIAPVAEKPTGITPSTTSNNDPQNPPPTRTTPASIPATTTSSISQDPPPPQPGARPLAPTASSNSYTPSPSSAPPAPQPGATAGGYTATHTTLETRLSAPPQQATLPPPNDAQLAGRSTTTSTTPLRSGPGPTTLPLGGPAAPVASPYQQEHSGGAVQPPSSLEGPPGYHQAPDNTPYAPLGGSGTGAEVSTGGDGSNEGVGAAAWSMLSKAGEALKKGEEATWKAIRNSK